MLNIKFACSDKTINYIDSEFRKNVTLERLNDKYSEHIVETIDETKHEKDHVFNTAIRGSVSEEQLSTGCKACLLMYWTDLEINATFCGDNCQEIIVDIANKKDVVIVLEYLMRMKDIGIFHHNGKIYNGYQDLVKLWISEVD